MMVLHNEVRYLTCFNKNHFMLKDKVGFLDLPLEIVSLQGIPISSKDFGK